MVEEEKGKRWPCTQTGSIYPSQNISVHHKYIPKELKDKVEQRAALNGRSLNAELVQIVQDAMSRPSPVIGYRSDTEKLTAQQAETVKKMVFETLVQMYADKK